MSSNSKVIFAQKDNVQIYAKDNHGNEFYPKTGQFASDRSGKPIYARDKDNKVIFPKNKDGNEYYLKDGDNPYITGLDTYVRLNDTSEAYPLFKDENGEFYERMIGSRYALDSQGVPYYPIDEDGNEMWLFESENQPFYYPITNDRFYIIPEWNDKPHLLKTMISPELEEKHITGKIKRRDGTTVGYKTNSIATNQTPRAKRKPYTVIPIDAAKPDPPNVNVEDMDIDNGFIEDDDDESAGQNDPNKNLNESNDDNSNENTNDPNANDNSNENTNDPNANDNSNENTNDPNANDNSNQGVYDDEDKSNHDISDAKDDSNEENGKKVNTKKKSAEPRTFVFKLDGSSVSIGNTFNMYYILTTLFTILLGILAWYFKRYII